MQNRLVHAQAARDWYASDAYYLRMATRNGFVALPKRKPLDCSIRLTRVIPSFIS